MPRVDTSKGDIEGKVSLNQAREKELKKAKAEEQTGVEDEEDDSSRGQCHGVLWKKGLVS